MKYLNIRENSMRKIICNGFSTALIVMFGAGVATAQAQDNSTYTAEPAIFSVETVPPKVLLTMSMDHQLFIKAYNDFEDIVDADGNPYSDGDIKDGVADITYQDGFGYVGYFNENKCYDYDSGSGIFKENTNAMENDSHYCAIGGWSGNFLNWLTMTRIDLVRSVMYGGYRSTDEPELTILERSYLPTDAHSYAKHYEGADIGNLTEGLPATNSCSGDADKECKGYTFCNTSKPPGEGISSEKVNTKTNPPLLRAIKGNYSLWASSERYQCLARDEFPQANGDHGKNGNNSDVTDIFAFDNVPESSTTASNVQTIADFNVRVQVCNKGTASDRCSIYSDNYKPTGILHGYEDGRVEFGLLTGSYNSNKDFGALRSNVKNFALEVNQDTGVFLRPENSIVSNLDAFRIVDYMFKGGTDAGTYNGFDADDGCAWGKTDFSNGKCRNWGNPFSELLAESYRYFSGTEVPKVNVGEGSNVSEIGLLTGLSVATWPSSGTDAGKAIQKSFACSNLNVLGINASSVSYDSDGFYADDDSSISINTLLGVNVNEGSTSIDSLTNTVGNATVGNGDEKRTVGELNDSGYFVGGVVGGTIDGECSSKKIAGGNLSMVRGTCPETPRLEGSYLGAGLAHFFHTKAETQVSTFGVTLAGALPSIYITTEGGREITVIPACRNKGDDGNDDDNNGDEANYVGVGRCALAGFKAVSVDATSGKYFISWEDSEQGGDYDTDLSGIISYTLDGDTLNMDTQITYESTGEVLHFGFIVSGAGSGLDGAYYPSKIKEDGNGQDGLGTDEQTATDWCKNNPTVCKSDVNNNKKIQRVTLNVKQGAPGQFLKEPLYYAAKWGSFKEEGEVNGLPDTVAEWGSGTAETGYKLDGYTEVKEPTRLRERVGEVLDGLTNRPTISSGTSVSLSSSTGIGLMVQSYYSPELKNSKVGDDGKTETEAVTWVGTLSGLLRDEYGNTREDTNSNGYVDDADYAISYVYDNDTTTVTRFTVDDGELVEYEKNGALDSVKNLWSAREQLAVIDESSTEAKSAYVDQRTWGNSAEKGRFIITGVDAGDSKDGQISSTEVVDFVATGEASIGGLLDLPNPTTDSNAALINYIRGVETAGMRSRVLNGKPQLLGDTIHSTPKIVSSPAEAYDDLGGDASYAVFRNKYKNRRQVVYTGANDGMLHAFNAGFLNKDSIGYSKGLKNGEDDNGDPTYSSEVQHPLGSELWAYIPYNLLPHLKWLASESYQHVYFMDGNIQQFDVNIFTGDEDTSKNSLHPGGWGTIIVAGMRLGGGDYTLDDNTTTLRSAYVILDVTNPEAPPTIIAEITDEDLGFTISNVDIVLNRTPVGSNLEAPDNAVNEWHLIMGSGSEGLTVQGGAAKLFSLDLKAAVEGNPTLNEIAFAATPDSQPAIAGSFVGGISVADWERDYQDDFIYFGLVENSTTTVNDEEVPVRGRLMQAKLSYSNSGALTISAPTMLLTGAGATDYAFSTAPLAIPDYNGNRWVYAGTGRFYVGADVGSVVQNTYVGVAVNGGGATTGDKIKLDDLMDVTDIRLYVNAAKDQHKLEYKGTDVLATDMGFQADKVVQLEDLNKYITTTKKGWIRNFASSAELVSGKSSFANDSLLVNSYDTSLADGCTTNGGLTRRYVFDMLNGMPQIRLVALKYVEGENGSGGSGGDPEGGLKETTSKVGETETYAPDTVVAKNKLITKGSKSEVIEDDIGLDPTQGNRRSWKEIPLDELN